MASSTPSKTKVSKPGGSLSAQYTFEKDNNKKQPRLPPNVKIQRRPILHPAISNPYARENVPKVVYVSASTPIMSAVKRTKKLLALIEKRALQKVKLPDPKQGQGKGLTRELEEATRKLKKEAVYIKASGRAVEKALRIGEWFKEKEPGVKVEANSGSTIVVDDLVEINEAEVSTTHQGRQAEEKTEIAGEEHVRSSAEDVASNQQSADVPMKHLVAEVGEPQPKEPTKSVSKKPTDKKTRKKRKRDTYELGSMPEARTRWIKTIEVAVSYAA